jgi:uncharacterized protein YraI
MKSARFLAVTTAFGLVLAGGQAALAFTATSSAHLNLRSGPGPQYPVVATIGHDDKIDVHGCLKEVTWCDVNWGDQRGWASADYIAYDTDNGPKVLPLAGDAIDIPLVTYDAVAVVTPEFVGEVKAVNGFVEAITPPKMVSAYVSEQAVDPVFVSGEVVVGSVLPETVPLYAVPESPYHFTVVNGQNVLVEKDTHKVVYIYR